MNRTLVYALTRKLAERWCQENDVQPRARTTFILTDSNGGGRGFEIRSDDRVVLVGPVVLREGFQDSMMALLPALVGPNVIEWHVPGTGLGDG